MKLILIGLVLTTSTAFCQSYILEPSGDEPQKQYCIPMAKARLLVADALRLRFADSLNNNLSARVNLLEIEKLASHHSFINLLKTSEQKYTTQKENTGHMERLAMSYKSERDYYIKRERKQRQKKNILSYGLLALLGIIIVK